MEPFACGFFTPESCAKAEQIQFRRPNGEPVIAIGIKLASGEPIYIPESLFVASSELGQGGTYSGLDIAAVTRDGQTRIDYIGSIDPQGLTQVAKEFPSGSLVATAGAGRVFDESDLTLIVAFRSVDGANELLRRSFPLQMAKAPRIVANTPRLGTPTAGVIFYDIPPPRSTLLAPPP